MASPPQPRRGVFRRCSYAAHLCRSVKLAKGFALDIPVSLVATVSVVCEPWAFSRPRLASLTVATHAVSKGEQNSRNVAHNRLTPSLCKAGSFQEKHMRYLITARVKPGRKQALVRSIRERTLGAGSIAGDEYLRN